MKKDQSTSTRTILLMAVTFVVAVCSNLAAQGQPAIDAAHDHFQADVINSPVVGWSQGENQSEADLLSEDFTHDSSVELLQAFPQTEKPSAHPVVRAGYGQFFSANPLVPHGLSAGSGPASCFYLKVSFSF